MWFFKPRKDFVQRGGAVAGGWGRPDQARCMSFAVCRENLTGEYLDETRPNNHKRDEKRL